MPLLGRLWSEGRAATDAVTLPLVLTAAVRVERRCAVRAGDPEILQAVVVGDTVDMVEDATYFFNVPWLPPAARKPKRRSASA
jgi:hypothetical protein